MSECEYTSICDFFQGHIKAMPETVALYKSMYCLGAPHNCARLLVAETLGIEALPFDLSPAALDIAFELIAAADRNGLSPPC